jgi:hypothetical protein
MYDSCCNYTPITYQSTSTHTQQLAELWFVYFNLYVPRQKICRRRVVLFSATVHTTIEQSHEISSRRPTLWLKSWHITLDTLQLTAGYEIRCCYHNLLLIVRYFSPSNNRVKRKTLFFLLLCNGLRCNISCPLYFRLWSNSLKLDILRHLFISAVGLLVCNILIIFYFVNYAISTWFSTPFIFYFK